MATKNNEVDIALHALCIHAAPGQTMTYREMADVCGCSPQLLDNIAQRALSKLRRMPRAREIYEAIEW